MQETERRLQEAERADKEDVASPGRRKSGEKKMVEARIKRRGLEVKGPYIFCAVVTPLAPPLSTVLYLT